MISKTTTITKSDIYGALGTTSEYNEVKGGDESAQGKLGTIDEDADMLDRFWSETKNAMCVALRRVLDEESEANGTYTVKLELSGSFDESLWPTMESDLKSYFVESVYSKWLTLFNYDKKAAERGQIAASFLDSVLRKAYFRKRPTRPTY